MVNFAARTVIVAKGDVVPIPQWVRALVAIDPCSVVLSDRAGVAMSVPVSGTFERPASVASCLVDNPGVLLLLY
jgi:hypothetical protein